MRLRFRPISANPIAIDLGYSTTKLLQVGEGCIEAADEIPVPLAAGEDTAARLESLGDMLPQVLSEGAFRGRRVIVAMPAFNTVLQAMQLDAAEATDEALAMEMRLPITTDPYMVRAIDVPAASGARREVICQAIPRGLVLRYVELLHQLKLNVVGVVAQPRPIVAAFNHLHRRTVDVDQCTMYVDLGFSGTTAVMAHGHDIVLARSIPIGGRHFDQRIALQMQCDEPAARRHRLSVKTPKRAMPPEAPVTGVPMLDAIGPEHDAMETVVAIDRRSGEPPTSLGPAVDGSPFIADHVDLSELIDTLIDDLRLCLRHHAATWPQVDVARVIFTGGEARQDWLCRQVVQSLHLPGQVGDPLARLDCAGGASPLVDWTNRGRPDWSVVAGLASMVDGGPRNEA